MDKDSYFRVERNWNRDGKIEGPAEFFFSIEKYDGCVIDIGQWGRIYLHPSVVPIIEKYLAQKKADQRD